MKNWILTQSPLTLTILASLFTWGMTALGSSLVFFFKDTKKEIMDAMLGFAAGIMMAAAFFSLLLPCVEFAVNQGIEPFIPAVIGFLLGCGLLYFADIIIPHIHEGQSEISGKTTGKLNRSAMLIFAIVLHNIPEGLAVGVAFGAIATGDSSAIFTAIALSIGIGIQNFPEGAAVSLPARRDGLSTMKAFLYGQFSGLVEPIAAIIGVLTVSYITPVMPYAMSFAAGAMVYVVFDEIIPTAHENGKSQLTTNMAVLGFTLMMMLDLAL